MDALFVICVGTCMRYKCVIELRVVECVVKCTTISIRKSVYGIR